MCRLSSWSGAWCNWARKDTGQRQDRGFLSLFGQEAAEGFFSIEEEGEVESRVERLERELADNQRILREVSDRLDVYGERLARVTEREGDEYSRADLPSPATAGDFEDRYEQGLRNFRSGRYREAMSLFEGLLQSDPFHPLASNCQYWIGECQDAANQREAALATFTRVLEEYPSSDKAAAAQLKKGLIYLKMGDQGQGVVNLQYVVYEHPGTREAELAREQLKSLGLTIR